MTEPIRIAAVGDCFITRRLPEAAPQAEMLRNLLHQADVRFANLETTIQRKAGPPSAFSGGTWAMADPGVLNELSYYGFNCLNAATNHSLDYLYEGLAATEKHLTEAGFRYAGIGSNMAEAARPAYVDIPQGRAALIACTSTFHESWIAGEQSPSMPGRPGIHPLRYETVHHIAPGEIAGLKEILQKTDIHADRHLLVKEGFISETERQDGTMPFGPFLFSAAENSREGTSRRPLKEDRERLVQLVQGACGEADVVLVSIHSHEMDGENKAAPADFHQEIAKELIDAGADAVIGHGPHVLRGIEIYRGKPIFYSLGNFIFQNETVSDLPGDFFKQYGLSSDTSIAEAFDRRSEGGKGLAFNPDVWESVVPYWEMADGRISKMTLYPIALGYGEPRSRRGWPAFTGDFRPMERLRELSRPFGTDIMIHADGTGEIPFSSA